MAFDFIRTHHGGEKTVARTKNTRDRDYYHKLYYPQERPNGPANFAYTIFGQGENAERVLSRIVPAKTTRTGTYLAHHLHLEKGDENQAACGPAFLLKKRYWFDKKWEHSSLQEYPRSVIMKNDYLKIHSPPTWIRCFAEVWQQELEKLLNTVNTEQKCVILFDGNTPSAGENILTLFYEAMSWLSPEQRWSVPFATSAAVGRHEALGWKWMGIDINDKNAEKRFIPKDYRGNVKPNGPTLIDLTSPIGE